MASKRKKASKAVPFNPVEVANIAKTNPYIQRLIEDAALRENVQRAIESSRSAYGRLGNGKAPAKSLLEDKKLQHDLREALEAIRDASVALTEAPKKRVRKGRRLGRKLLVLTIGAGVALAGSEKLRSKLLDTLFGAEEEFQYTPPPAATTPPAAPVSAA
jgi:anti-sigma factor RsiW